MNSAALPLAVASASQAPHLSNRYVRIDTSQVIRALESEGFAVRSIRADNPRQRDPAHVRHEVTFHHPKMRRNADGEPLIRFINSHNGTTRASYLFGWFRFVCSNGMVVGNAIANARVRHAGDDARSIIDGIRRAAERTTELIGYVESWAGIELSPEQQRTLARHAAELRRRSPTPALCPLSRRMFRGASAMNGGILVGRRVGARELIGSGLRVRANRGWHWAVPSGTLLPARTHGFHPSPPPAQRPHGPGISFIRHGDLCGPARRL